MRISRRRTHRKGSGGGGGMDCCVCSPTAVGFRLPRNSICVSCYEGARCMIAFLNDLETGRSSDEGSAPAAVKARALRFPGSSDYQWLRFDRQFPTSEDQIFGFSLSSSIVSGSGGRDDMFHSLFPPSSSSDYGLVCFLSRGYLVFSNG